MTYFYRTDLRGARTIFTNVTHRGALIRVLPLLDSRHMLGLHRDGNLVLYDGMTGSALTSLLLSESGFPANQTSPFLQHMQESVVFVAVPSTGRMHEVLINHTAMPRSMTAGAVVTVGGSPQHMVVARRGGDKAYH